MKNINEMLAYERMLLAEGKRLVAGVDEAGRGPLAGPVAVSAVIMPLDDLIFGVDDSKKLTEKKREAFFDIIMEKAVCAKSVFADVNVIDEINILNATKQCMKEAVCSLFPLPEAVLIDAVKLDLPYPSFSIIHGDGLSYSIAAASIVAKVNRDRLMVKYAEKYPEYHFEEHKGYCTALHIEMLKKYGPCEIHRKSFLKNLIL